VIVKCNNIIQYNRNNRKTLTHLIGLFIEVKQKFSVMTSIKKRNNCQVFFRFRITEYLVGKGIKK
jgi:hypothetical protein